MSDLDDVRDDLARLNSFHPQTLLSALMEADSQIKRIEKTRDEYSEAHDLVSRRAGLYARRCELALAILRDDEAGLTNAKLQQIADVLWPQPIDETQKPTRSSSTEERQLAQLLHIGVVSIREILNLLPVGSVSIDIECTECGHIQSRDVGPTIELGGLKHQIESFILCSKELLKLYGY